MSGVTAVQPSTLVFGSIQSVAVSCLEGAREYIHLHSMIYYIYKNKVEFHIAIQIHALLMSSSLHDFTFAARSGCGTETTVYLAETCSVPLVSDTLSGGQVTFDTRLLTPGMHYKLCSDLDGAGNQSFGDSGLLIYVSGVSGARRTVGPGLTQLQLDCTGGCSELSSAFLTTSSCDDVWVVNGVMRRGSLTPLRSSDS